VASSLPINYNLIQQGLLNNPDSQFLFSALPQAAGTHGTPAFDPIPPRRMDRHQRRHRSRQTADMGM